MVPEPLEKVTRRLKELVGSLPTRWELPLENRIYMDVKPEDARELARLLYEDLKARFVTASGLDAGEELEVVYHFAYDAAALVINVRVRTPKAEAKLPALTPVVPPAEWIEREVRDLVGIEFEGHPRPERLILADDWPEGVYPLRKDSQNGE